MGIYENKSPREVSCALFDELNCGGTRSRQTKEYAYFVERLRKAREEAGLTQTEVAKKLKGPQSQISNVESGQQRVDVVELQFFARIYNKDINYFIK